MALVAKQQAVGLTPWLGKDFTNTPDFQLAKGDWAL
jgi:hypothetical protein